MVNNCIPLILTNQYGNKYPGIWDKIEIIFEKNKDNKHPDYYAEFLSVISDYDNNRYVKKVGNLRLLSISRDSEDITDEPSILDALYKWRIHKQIYRFPKEFEQLLYNQNNGLDTPIYILNSLPYDSIYIETNYLDENVLGFFIYKDYQSYTVVLIYDDMTYEHSGFNFNQLTSTETTLEEALCQQSEKEGLGFLGYELCMNTNIWDLMPKILQLVLYI